MYSEKDRFHKEMLEGLHRAGKMLDVPAAKELFGEAIDEELQPLSAQEIKAIRKTSGMSQPVFARMLNVSPATVKAWEQSANRPEGAALKLLHIVNRNGISVLI